MTTKTRDAAIRSFYADTLTPEIKVLISMALRDLWYGPGSGFTEDTDEDGAPWPGFEKACARISKALPTGDLWFDTQAEYVTDTEPRWRDPETDTDDGEDPGEWPEDWISIDARAVKVALVGKELAQYV